MKENKDKNEHNKYVRILNVKAVNLDWRISRVSRLQHAVIKDWKKIMVEGRGINHNIWFPYYTIGIRSKKTAALAANREAVEGNKPWASLLFDKILIYQNFQKKKMHYFWSISFKAHCIIQHFIEINV